MLENFVLNWWFKPFTRLNQICTFGFNINWIVLLNYYFSLRWFRIAHSHKIKKLRHLSNWEEVAKPYFFRSNILFLLIYVAYVGICSWLWQQRDFRLVWELTLIAIFDDVLVIWIFRATNWLSILLVCISCCFLFAWFCPRLQSYFNLTSDCLWATICI
jgi:hypothetical protein